MKKSRYLLISALIACAFLLVPLVSFASTGAVSIGKPVTITVTNDGTPPFTYQWFKDGTAITGATSASFKLTTTTLADAGTYTVKISNAWGFVVSDQAVLTVNGLPPTIGTTSFELSLVVSPQPKRLMLSQFVPGKTLPANKSE